MTIQANTKMEQLQIRWARDYVGSSKPEANNGEYYERYTGQVSFSNGLGKVELNFTPDLIQSIMSLVADHLAEQNRRMVAEMTGAMLEVAGIALPAPSDPYRQREDDTSTDDNTGADDINPE